MKFKKLLILTALAIFAVNLFAQEFNDDRITLELLNALEAEPDKAHTVFVMLEDQLDVRALENELLRRKASLEERAYEVITKLQAKAAATQPDFLQQLKALEGVDKASIKPYWIVNTVFFDATPEAIAALSRNDAVDYIDGDWPVEIYDLEQDRTTLAPRKLDNTETGLEAIGATQMWAMGYTGYGRSALIVDTGVDRFHPALFNNYAYHNRSEDASWSSNGPRICESDHGTHVSGIAVGIDRILRDTIGVAYEGEWLGGPIPLSDCNYSGSVQNNLATFQWALNPDGNASTTDDMPDVVNNSWGRPNPSFIDCNLSQWTGIYDAMMAAGIAVVYAAGNEGPGVSTVGHPAINNYDLVRFFSVGNLNANNASLPIANGSSRGPTICGGEGSLLIKPEVSAPGTDVRSSVFNGSYNTYTGTSMAAPHVAGAIMLLKEAFPYLAGEDLMLALYFTAIDLGDEGEDNDYGMGIINVPAAFQYLVDEGHEPVEPVSTTNDLVLLRAEVNDLSCLEGVEAFIEVENDGEETVESILVTAYFTGSQDITETYEWELSLLPEERAELQLPPMMVPAGEYELVIELTEANGIPDERILNNRIKHQIKVIAENKFEANILGDVVPCENSQVVLRSGYEGDAVVEWYDEAEGGSLLGEGPNVLLDAGAAPSTVYMQVAPVERLGKEDDQTGNIQFSDDNNGLYFDTEVPIIIRTVKVYADESGGRIIRLKRADGSVGSAVVSLEAGENIVEVDFVVSPGEGHEIFLNAGKPLAFSLGGTDYPYEVPNVISITGPSAGSGIFYHYFFDWEIEYEYACGRTPVEVEVQSASSTLTTGISPSTTEVDLSGEETSVTFTAESDNAVSWYWDFGDGNESTEQEPTHTYADTGNYLVTLTVVGADGCSNSAAVEVSVIETPVVDNTIEQLASQEVVIFPNPTTSEVLLQFKGRLETRLDYYLVDMFGRRVSEVYQTEDGQNTYTLSLGALPSGTYMLVMSSEKGRAASRIVK